ncbi:MAG: FkbM family methyltransferase [Lewinellaceae bacterium]|nr:FkbM family methyltransferase [Lewinellaceae bacterium]
MAQRFGQVFAFEANRSADFDLLHYQKPNVHFFQYGLSDANETRVLHVPVRQGIPVVGWASIGRRTLPFADAFLELPVELQRLDDQPFVQNQAIDLIKIDVEGHELEVLRGGLETIRRNKPVLLIEDNTEQRAAIRKLLEATGYRSVTFAEISGKSLPSPNLIWIAKEP